MKNYKQWSPKERMAGYRIVMKAIDAGMIKKPCKCQFCGNEYDIHYHQENYDDPLNKENLKEVCFRCHIMFFHNEYKPYLTDEYRERLSRGIKFNEVINRQQFLAKLKNNIYD